MLGVIHDEDASHVELEPAPMLAIPEIERRMRWVSPFAEARWSWITSPGLPMLTGPLRTVSFMAGVRLETP